MPTQPAHIGCSAAISVASIFLSSGNNVSVTASVDDQRRVACRHGDHGGSAALPPPCRQSKNGTSRPISRPAGLHATPLLVYSQGTNLHAFQPSA